MIKLNQLYMHIGHSEEELVHAMLKALRISQNELISYSIHKRSIDARKHKELRYSYSIVAEVSCEERLLKNKKLPIERYSKKSYSYKITGEKELTTRPVVVGSGPAGLFCAFLLAKEGYRPILIERGRPVEDRVRDVEHFFETGELNPESNVQFGEGGAGTFSDGKLNTLIKDKDGKFAYLMDCFVRFGAPEEIRYINKPHIGTDYLRNVIIAMREEILKLGGEIRYSTKMDGIVVEDGRLTGVSLSDGSMLSTSVCVLAIGHSARDTFEMLHAAGVPMENKAFAIGVRVQHPRTWVNELQYGEYADKLPTADYKVTHQCSNGRGVYSFCMCPGGFVVNASSEEGRIAINGMSNHDRMADNSNSAIVVTIQPEDYLDVNGKADPLAGMHYQRRLEELAYREGNGKVPTQRYEDFVHDRPSTSAGEILPCNKGAISYGNVRKCLPEAVCDSILEGMVEFERRMPGFGHPDTLMSIIESRTSSPIRITRTDELQSPGIYGLYPCGEGAGYAGGITSAAMDGMRVFEQIIKEYQPKRGL